MSRFTGGALSRAIAVAMVGLAVVLLGACAYVPFGRAEESNTAPIAATATLVPTLTPAGPTATPVPVVTATPVIVATPDFGILDARFRADVTIPDGTAMAPGESFTKIWLLENTGEVAWPEQTELQRVDGPSFGPVESVSLRVREAGETAEIAVEMVAPNEPGLQRSYWQLCVDGQCFGSRIWVEIRVQAQNQ